MNSFEGDFLQQIDRAIGKDDLEAAQRLCEVAIESAANPTAYWYLGLIALLQEQETDAQAIWLLAMAEGEPAEIDEWTIELAEILRREALRRWSNLPLVHLLRQHLRELLPSDLDNLLHLLQLTEAEADLSELTEAAIALLQTASSVEAELLQTTLQHLIVQNAELAADLAAASLPAASASWIDQILLPQAIVLAASGDLSLADRYARLCLQLDAQHVLTLAHLSRIALAQGRYRDSIELAQRYSKLAPTLAHQLTGNTLLLKGLLSLGSAWTAAAAAQQQQIALLKAYLTDSPTSSDAAIVCSPLYYAPYLSDSPQQTRSLQNQAAAAYQLMVRSLKPSQVSKGNKLRIGYLSRCLRQHSVGWLSRWVFQHYDRDRFEVYAYFLQSGALTEFSQRWFAAPATLSRLLAGDAQSIAAQIQADAIDILVDLDSITVPLTCEVMALKPAPIQVTWLGSDASGLPAIDYFLADPYVLPDDAPAYYCEKIWRLPQTYIAVDGFEIGVPTLRRESLDIPADAIVYFSAQSAYKRHPDTVRAQMQILQRVPNSYFLVKGIGDEQGLRQFFEAMAKAAGVSRNRLRFLPLTPDEVTHRANLAIADVVLDTFPYNGATTTLETLWMGVPLVTQVGQQFAARNSYTMLKNVGIEAGIAWSVEEYVAWGVKFGENAALRQQVSHQLRQSRQTAPLWNAQQFTRQLEQAYLQMCEQKRS